MYILPKPNPGFLELPDPTLEAGFFKKGVLTTFWPIINFFCFQSNLDQTQSDCSAHEQYNLTKFGQDLTENKNFSLQAKQL